MWRRSALQARAGLQYSPSDDEIRIIVRQLPICIEGEPTEEEEVSGYRDLARIETNRVRGGIALVSAEGIALKAAQAQEACHKTGHYRLGVARLTGQW